jgi:ComF family protein
MDPCPPRHSLCQACFNELPHLDVCCPTCAAPQPHGLTCGACLKNPVFGRALIPFHYTDPCLGLLHSFKFNKRPVAVASLLWQLQQRLEHESIKPDRLLPIPSHWRRLIWRGYDSPLLIARYLHKHSGIPIQHALRRQRSTPHQLGLARKQRLKNMRGAFKCIQDVSGLHIALVDDVYTTGSTAREAAKTLLKAGAKRVDIYCLARTPEKH